MILICLACEVTQIYSLIYNVCSRSGWGWGGEDKEEGRELNVFRWELCPLRQSFVSFFFFFNLVVVVVVLVVETSLSTV